MENNIFDVIVKNCSVYYDNYLISEENIIKKYKEFIADSLLNNDKITFASHTGSPCFDAVSIVAVSFACISMGLNKNDEILETLEENDIVIYKGSRYRWKGTFNENGVKKFAIEADGKKGNGNCVSKIPYEKNKHMIKPYYGTSKKTDSRGMRKNKLNRESFIAKIMGTDISEIPTDTLNSVVIVAEKSYFDNILNKIQIAYKDDEKKTMVFLKEIMPITYYTEDGEYQFGKNQTQTEPIIKTTSKISVARRLVIEKGEIPVKVFLLLKSKNDIDNDGELDNILEQKSLDFAFISQNINFGSMDALMEKYPNAKVFACTREYLKNISDAPNIKCKYTTSLSRQIYNIVNGKIITVHVKKGWNWKEFCDLKNRIFEIKNSETEQEIINDFILSAYVILNLLNTAIFPISDLESAINNRLINNSVVSPTQRFKEMEEIAKRAGNIQEKFMRIIEILNEKYQKFFNYSPKGTILKQLIQENPGKRITVIIPKKYYRNILESGILKGFYNVTCMTPGDFEIEYGCDIIIAICDKESRKFNALQCFGAEKIYMLLYDCEEYMFKRKQIKAKSILRKINKRANTEDKQEAEVAENVVDDDGFNEMDYSIITEKFADLDRYIKEISSFDVNRFVRSLGKHIEKIGAPTIKIENIGFFANGNKIFFSKYYKAVVYKEENGNTEEVDVDSLNEGNLLVFVKRNDNTRNTVDLIYDEILSAKKFNEEIVSATEKASFWKNILREYMQNNSLKHRDIVEMLDKYGVKVNYGTVRQWVAIDSHIVGPQKREYIIGIGKITGNEELISKSEEYFNAFKIVRKKRKEILNFISRAINDKLKGNLPQKDTIYETIYNNLGDLTMIYELVGLERLENAIEIPISWINKPISETEG